uniref:Uncharacterized protein n=1 Tax=Rhizophora mucronata TaxID=61149 RepID=A0A2P2QTQ2_RHIMU
MLFACVACPYIVLNMKSPFNCVVLVESSLVLIYKCCLQLQFPYDRHISSAYNCLYLSFFRI